MLSPELEQALEETHGPRGPYVTAVLEELEAAAALYRSARGRENLATARQRVIELALELIELVERYPQGESR